MLSERVLLVVPFVITAIFAFLTIDSPLIIDEQIEALLADYRFKIRNVLSPPPVPDNIIIVAVNEESLLKHGRWPWSRRLQARLIEKVFEGNPSVVAVDIFYPEAESPESDLELADVMARHRKRLVVALGFEVEEDKMFGGEIGARTAAG